MLIIIMRPISYDHSQIIKISVLFLKGNYEHNKKQTTI